MLGTAALATLLSLSAAAFVALAPAAAAASGTAGSASEAPDCGPLELRWQDRIYRLSADGAGTPTDALGEATLISCGRELAATATVRRIEGVDAEDALIAEGGASGRFERVSSTGEKGSAVLVIALAIVACVVLIELGRRRMRRRAA